MDEDTIDDESVNKLRIVLANQQKQLSQQNSACYQAAADRAKQFEQAYLAERLNAEV